MSPPTPPRPRPQPTIPAPTRRAATTAAVAANRLGAADPREACGADDATRELLDHLGA